jgi:hypothetical protein
MLFDATVSRIKDSYCHFDTAPPPHQKNLHRDNLIFGGVVVQYFGTHPALSAPSH